MIRILTIIILLLLYSCSSKIMLPRNANNIRTDAGMRGEIVFMKNCSRCHPGGMAGLGPAIINKPLPGFMMRFQVRQGLGAMPAFSKDHLSKEHMNDLVVYLKELHSDYRKK